MWFVHEHTGDEDLFTFTAWYQDGAMGTYYDDNHGEYHVVDNDMGRAAGETAPIIFTAAVSFGRPLQLIETFTQGTPALPWNVYNQCCSRFVFFWIGNNKQGIPCFFL
mgnify:CR=1 FL=1